MRTKLLVLALALAACGDDGNMLRNDGSVNLTPDAPEFAPSITSLTASPSSFAANTPTMVTFSWTLLVNPTYPEPTCTIDNGVGPVMSGMPVSVTISAMTLMTMTCSNRAGSSQRQVILNTLPAAPQIATFTMNPTSVAPNTSTPITFTWTYANSPSPAPTCSIDNGQTTITSGTAVNMTLTQARTFRLRCTNSQGSAFTGTTVADLTLAVNECGTAYAQCDPHATCTDTTDSYTCACGSAYTTSGDQCLYTTATPGDCDTNCPLIGASCVPRGGYVGSGQLATAECKRARFTFVTSTTYAGTAITGLAGADAICAARAAAYNVAPYTTGLPGTYVAWMSDVANDAYCRAQTDGSTGHLNGKKSGSCGLGSLPVAAGPWVRVGDWKQWSPTIDKLLAPNHVTYYPANTSDLGTEIASTTDRVWTGTDDAGTYVANGTCADWTATGVGGVYGEVHGGGQSWTQSSATTATCSNAYHIRCVEVSSTPSPTLPPRHPTGMKKAFLTSVIGNGQITTWPDNYGQTAGLNAADSVCQARARYAGYPNASTFKAWLDSYPSYITSGRINASASSYVRPDGVVIGTSRADLLDGKLQAAFNQSELNTYLAGNADTGAVWTGIGSSGATNGTGSYYSSSTSYSCLAWSYNFSYQSTLGRHDLLDSRSMYNSLVTCDQTGRLYCVEDQ